MKASTAPRPLAAGGSRGGGPAAPGCFCPFYYLRFSCRCAFSLSDSGFGKGVLRYVAIWLVLASTAILGGVSHATAQDDPSLAAWIQHLRGAHEPAAGQAEQVLADDPLAARAAFCLAAAWYELDRVTVAREFFTEIEQHTASSGIGALGLGTLDFHERDFAGAETHLQAALERFQNRGDRMAELVAREQLGAALIELARPPEAIAMLTAAMELAGEMDRPHALALSQLNLGRALVRTREVERAGEMLQAALSAAGQFEIPLWEGIAGIALSVLSRWRMDLDEALAYRQLALDAYRRANHLPGQARALHYIGTIHALRGELTLAMRDLHDGLALARQTGDAGEQCGCLSEMAGISFLLGDLEGALAQFTEAVRIADNPHRAGWLRINIASILAYQERYAEALPQLRQARDAVRQFGDVRNEVSALQLIGQCLCELQRYEEGLATLDEAIAISREWGIPMNEAYALHYKGHAQLIQGDLSGAESSLAAAVTIAQQTGHFDIIESSLVEQSIVARKRGAGDEALGYLEQALDVVAEVRRRSGGSPTVQREFYSEAVNTYEEMINLLYELDGEHPQQQYARRAFDVAQEAKARSFLDLLVEAEVDLRCNAHPRFQQREAEIQETIANLDEERLGANAGVADSLTADISRLESELVLLEAELRDADPRFAELRYPRPYTSADTQTKLLRPDEVLLEYSLGDSASYLWVVSDSSFSCRRLPRRPHIEAQVRELMPLITDYNVLGSDPSYFIPAARQLYESLLAPAAAEIARADRLIIAPDGILHYLPFETLLTEQPAPSAATDFASLPYLIEQAVVNYIPSVSILARLRAGERATIPSTTADLLLVGDPVQHSDDAVGMFARAAGTAQLPPLPHVGDELARLRQLVPAAQSLVLAGSDATVANLQAATDQGAYRFIHFATHGLFNEKSPQYSGLVLSPDPAVADDGFLTTAEVFALDLASEQIVLSACATALGEQVHGEGLVGLTRGFLFAGARSVVAALWDVSGRSTSLFMQEYYRLIAGAEAGSRAAAFADAKRRLIRGELVDPDGAVALDHPYFWAAFVLTGAE